MKKMAVVTASLVAAFGLMGIGAQSYTSQTTAQAATSTSPTISVNTIYNNSTKVTGKATKGVAVVIRNAKNKTIAKGTASSTTGAYSVKLPAKQKTGTKLYVYAHNNKTGRYFYRIMTVKAASTKSSTTSTTSSTTSKTTSSTSSSSTKSSTASFKVSTPTGTWKSATYKGWAIQYTFSQKTGLTEKVTYGKKTAYPVKLATYSVTTKTPTFWKINVTPKTGKKTSFYMRFTAKNKFVIVNSKNQKIKASVGKAPAAYYTYTLQK